MGFLLQKRPAREKTIKYMDMNNIIKKDITRPLIIILILGFAVFALVKIFSGGGRAPEQVANSSVEVGQTGYLDSGGDNVVLGTTKESYDRMISLSVAHDTLGIAQMVLTGQAIMVNKGTSVKVISSGVSSREVRILDGKYYGSSGWVPYEFVHQNK